MFSLEARICWDVDRGMKALCGLRNKARVVCNCEHKYTGIGPITFGNAMHTTMSKRLMHRLLGDRHVKSISCEMDRLAD